VANKPRKPWLAGLLTSLTIGLGHIYAGAPRRGIVLFFAQGIFLLQFVPVIFFKHSLGILLLLFFLGSGYFIFCFLDAVKVAKRGLESYELKKYNRWYVYLACLLLAALVIQTVVETTVKKHFVQAYKIPAGSMIPALLPGDHILVNKFIYQKSEPQRGDIIVFEYPKNPSQDYVKRLIGLAGDVVEIENKQLFINGHKYREDYAINGDLYTFPGYQSPRDNFGPVVVPDGFLFVLGDNRDNSADSRFWGFVGREKIKGKVIGLYWSWDREAGTVRWDRIGNTII
jgi:signal peptidase I